MKATLIHTQNDWTENYENHCRTRSFLRETRTICVKDFAGCSMHVSYVYRVVLSSHDQRELTRNLVPDSIIFERCNCYVDRLDEGVQFFKFELNNDGDSGKKFSCHGKFHFEFRCYEFGMGWDVHGSPKPCDGSCHEQIRVPPSVAQLIRNYRRSPSKPNEESIKLFNPPS
jgi:hypothetical protein